MNDGPHHHPCVDCHERTECFGTLERNFDGIPDVICQEYHVTFGRYDHRCEVCQEKFDEQAAADRLENEPVSIPDATGEP